MKLGKQSFAGSSQAVARLCACVATAAAAIAAHAGEQEIRAAVEAMYPSAKVNSITQTAVPGIFEVVSGTDIVYSDAAGKTLFFGPMVDVATRTNVTEQRISQITAITFSELPLELAVKTVKGNGSRVLATFEDPNCGYCKALHRSLAGLTDYTLYTFLLPILGGDSKSKTNAIWCSTDASRAFTDWMTKGVRPPEPAAGCTPPTDKVIDLAKRLRIQGTPAMYFADNTTFPGAMPAQQLERKLSQVAATTSSARR